MPYHEALPCSVNAPVAGFTAAISRRADASRALAAGVFVTGALLPLPLLARSALSDDLALSGSAGSGRLATLRREPQPEIQARQRTPTHNTHRPRREIRKLLARPANCGKLMIADSKEVD